MISPSHEPLPTHNTTHRRGTSKPSAGFEPAIPAINRLKTYGLDRRGRRDLQICHTDPVSEKPAATVSKVQKHATQSNQAVLPACSLLACWFLPPENGDSNSPDMLVTVYQTEWRHIPEYINFLTRNFGRILVFVRRRSNETNKSKSVVVLQSITFIFFFLLTGTGKVNIFLVVHKMMLLWSFSECEWPHTLPVPRNSNL